MRRLHWLLQSVLCLGLVFTFGATRADDPPKDKSAEQKAADEKAKADAKRDEDYELMRLFVDSFEQIERNYVKDVDRKALIQAAIRGMVSQLDPYSNYISPEELKRFNQEVEQEFGGVGIQVQIDPKTRRLMVMTPLPGTPAYKAGVKAGDLIMEVEGKSTEGITLEEAVKLLQGKPGTEVSISIQHSGSDKIEPVKLTRALIQVATVLGDTHKADDSWNFFIDEEHKIAYIRLSHFGRRSGDELEEVLKTLTKEGMKGLILDLRFNPGGLLGQATRIADLFLESGTIVSVKGRNTENRVWTAEKAGTYSGFPMAVLINRFSASASEIVSAALQDHKRAVIVGERSWGKGSVQNVIELDSGTSALKLTTAQYLRPSGRNIHKFPGAKDDEEWGVSPDPDHKIEFSQKELLDYSDYRRKRDVLGAVPANGDFIDRQLNDALAYIKAQLAGGDTKQSAKAD
jgi:carboxyl-terminal processing protease